MRYSNIEIINYKKKNIYKTFNFKLIDEDFINSIDYEVYTWNLNSTYFKLANEYYNDFSFWWVIGLINKKPNDSELKVGEQIIIPLQIEDVLSKLNF